jgi:hypothetical protein
MGADAKLFLNPVESAGRTHHATFPFTHGAASRHQFSFFIVLIVHLLGSLTAHLR